MIRIDHKVCRDILRITNRYDVSIIYDAGLEGFAIWSGCRPENVVVPSVPTDDVPGALQRLSDRGVIKKLQGLSGGGMIFRVTPQLRHAKAFWFDQFTKTYFGGFVSGVLATVVGGIILHFIGLLW